jgi:hypothetical protein
MVHVSPTRTPTTEPATRLAEIASSRDAPITASIRPITNPAIPPKMKPNTAAAKVARHIISHTIRTSRHQVISNSCKLPSPIIYLCTRGAEPIGSPPLLPCSTRTHTGAAMGFNKRKMDDTRRQTAEKEAAARRTTEKQILEDAEQLVVAWNEHPAKRMPMLFSPTIGAAITAGHWFLRARCPACRTTGDVDLRPLDWHRSAAVTALTHALSCRSCRPNAPFAELVCLFKSSVAEEYYAERKGNRWVDE